MNPIEVPLDSKLRLFSYADKSGTPRLGFIRPGGHAADVADAAHKAGHLFSFDGTSMLALIEAGPRGLDELRKVAAADTGRRRRPCWQRASPSQPTLQLLQAIEQVAQWKHGFGVQRSTSAISSSRRGVCDRAGPPPREPSDRRAKWPSPFRPCQPTPWSRQFPPRSRRSDPRHRAPQSGSQDRAEKRGRPAPSA